MALMAHASSSLMFFISVQHLLRHVGAALHPERTGTAMGGALRGTDGICRGCVNCAESSQPPPEVFHPPSPAADVVRRPAWPVLRARTLLTHLSWRKKQP